MRNPFAFLYPNNRPRKRDYSAPSLRSSNPMHPPKRRRGFPWLVLVFILAIAGGGTWLMTTPRYHIQSIQIDGTDKLDRGSIERFANEQLDRRWLGVAWRRVSPLVPTEQLARDIQAAAEQLVPLGGVTVEKTSRTSLAIHITERVPNFLWEQSAGSRYFIDDQGVILEPAPDTLIRDLPAIVDANGVPADPGTRVVNPAVLAASRAVRNRLPTLNVTAERYSTWPVSCVETAPATDLETTNTNVNGNANVNNNRAPDPVDPEACDPDALAVSEMSFFVTTAEGWDIRFTAATDIEVQLTKLATALRERLEKRTSLRYVDVRFGDRVFFQ